MVLLSSTSQFVYDHIGDESLMFLQNELQYP
jgi:hypothetical protein